MTSAPVLTFAQGISGTRPAGIAPTGTQPATAEVPRLELTLETRAAIDLGLKYFAGIQQPDGSLRGSRGGNTGVVSYVVLSFLGAGHQPGRGRYGREIDRSVGFILRNVQPSGLISNPQDTSNGPMYEHAMSTTMLAEILGQYERPGLLDTLQRAVDLILACQNDRGGWRYLPRKADADLSVTVMQIVALRAARGAGIHVPQAAMHTAAGYVKSCATQGGGFLYQPGVGEVGYARTGAGVTSLLTLGLYDAPEAQRGIRFLQENKSPDRRGKIYMYYGLYYTAQAMYLWPHPRQWQQWYPPIRDELLRLQRPDGHWDGEAGPIYGTEMAILTLAPPYRYLPVYQH